MNEPSFKKIDKENIRKIQKNFLLEELERYTTKQKSKIKKRFDFDKKNYLEIIRAKPKNNKKNKKEIEIIKVEKKQEETANTPKETANESFQ